MAKAFSMAELEILDRLDAVVERDPGDGDRSFSAQEGQIHEHP